MTLGVNELLTDKYHYPIGHTIIFCFFLFSGCCGIAYIHLVIKPTTNIVNIEYLLDYEKNNYKMRDLGMFYESNESMCHESCGNETHSRCSNNLGLDFIIFMSLGNCTNSLTH